MVVGSLILHHNRLNLMSNSSLNDKFLDFRFRLFYLDKKGDSTVKFVYKRTKNSARKGADAITFYRLFSKAFYRRLVKSRECVVQS